MCRDAAATLPGIHRDRTRTASEPILPTFRMDAWIINVSPGRTPIART
jgi:hypothetical protein